MSGVLRPQQLDRHDPPEKLVLSPPDLARPAGRDLFR
jgi:hypothetical protein